MSPEGSPLGLQADLAYALDPVAFAEDRLGFTPDEWQERLLRSTALAIIVNVTRQGGKSTAAAIKTAHASIYDPGLTLLVSPSLRQSTELFSKVTGYLKELEPAEVLLEDNRQSCTLANGSRIASLPGDPNTTRGFSAPKRIIVDEASRIDRAMFAALRPMLATSNNGQLILISTPNGRQGQFFEVWENGEGWERYEVPARACPRISAEYLEAEMRELGPLLYSQEFECAFIDPDTTAFSSELIEAALQDFEAYRL